MTTPVNDQNLMSKIPELNCLYILLKNKDINNLLCLVINTALEIKMLNYWFKGLLFFVLSVTVAFAGNKTTLDNHRGAMLYENHCLECHTQQIHWREKKMVTDWKSLITEVDRWQDISGLEWGKSDIEAVSRYLNGKFYHYP